MKPIRLIACSIIAVITWPTVFLPGVGPRVRQTKAVPPMLTLYTVQDIAHMYAMACSEMIHLMVLPNPDTLDLAKRPQHGGRDRHVCIGMSLSPSPGHDAAGMLCIHVATATVQRPAVHLESISFMLQVCSQSVHSWTVWRKRAFSTPSQ